MVTAAPYWFAFCMVHTWMQLFEERWRCTWEGEGVMPVPVHVLGCSERKTLRLGLLVNIQVKFLKALSTTSYFLLFIDLCMCH